MVHSQGRLGGPAQPSPTIGQCINSAGLRSNARPPLYAVRRIEPQKGAHPCLSNQLSALLGDVVDIDAERGRDLLERLDRTFACSGLDLRNVGRRKTRRLSKCLDGQAAVLTPDP